MIMRFSRSENISMKHASKKMDELRQKVEELELFQTIFDNAMDGILVLDIETKKFYLGNKKACKALGYTPEELTKLGIEDIHPKEELKHIEEVLERTAKGESTLARDLPVKRKDGSIFYADIYYIPVEMAGKIYMKSILRDVTERKEVERALEKEKERGQKYLDIVEVIIMALDINGNITLINNKGCEILGYKKEEIIGKNWFDTFLPEGVRDELKKVFKKLMKGDVDAVERYENPILTKSGEERVIEWRNSILRDEEGNIIGVLSSGLDITERKRMEEALKEALQNEKEFKLKTAHYFFNPIAIAKGYLELAMEEGGEKEKIKKAIIAINRVEKVVKNVTQRGEVVE